jgi:hypothetical protein
MNDLLNRHIRVALALILIAGAVGIGAWVAHHNQVKVAAAILTEENKLEGRMFELAELTDRNGADAATEAIIADCARRGEYETLLNNLGKLTKKDLIAVQGLFESCGSFYAERKAVMVAKLDRELEAYVTFSDLLKTVDPKQSPRERIEQWRQLVELEKNRSTLLIDQNRIQAEIITHLISGSSVSSTEVSSNVRDAQDVGDLLTVDDHKIDALRAELKP